MNSFVFDIGEKAQKIALFVGTVHAELQRALMAEKKTRKLTQQSLAKLLGVNRSVINRQLMGYENLTIRRVAELAWALGWEIEFSLRKESSISEAEPASPVVNATTLVAQQTLAHWINDASIAIEIRDLHICVNDNDYVQTNVQVAA